jgi:1,4-dihydroxy-2-naphthoate octaprenyltransferase
MTAATREQFARLPRPLLWVIAVRLKTIGLSLTPVLCGTWLAAKVTAVDPYLAVLAGLAAAAIQIGTNLWNDAADADRGTDTEERLGPPRMTALGLLDSRTVKRAALLSFAAAVLAGLPLVLAGGWPILAVGIASLSLGHAYSMGPLPLSHTPLGEIIVFFFFGVVAVAGTAFVLGASLSAPVLTAGAMIGLPSSAVLLLNNHRDRLTDARAGRRTLAILIGETGARVLYGILLLAAAAILPVLLPETPFALALTALAAAVALMLAAAHWRTPVSRSINRYLPLTVLYQFALFAIIALTGGTAP